MLEDIWEGSPYIIWEYAETRTVYQRQPNTLNRHTATHTISKQLKDMKERLVKAERQTMPVVLRLIRCDDTGEDTTAPPHRNHR